MGADPQVTASVLMHRVNMIVRETRISGVKGVELRPRALSQALAGPNPITAITRLVQTHNPVAGKATRECGVVLERASTIFRIDQSIGCANPNAIIIGHHGGNGVGGEVVVSRTLLNLSRF